MTEPAARFKYLSVIIFCFFITCYEAGAQTWVKKDNGLNGGHITEMIFFNDTLYAGTFDDGVYASGDRGLHWSQYSQNLPANTNISSFAVNNDSLFIGLFNSGGVFVKAGNRKSWYPITTDGLRNLQVNSLLFQGNKLYAGTVNGIYLSTNRKAQWQSINSGFQVPPLNADPNTQITQLCTAGASVMAVDQYRGPYLLQSNGTWQVDSIGIKPGTYITALANNNGDIYCTSFNELYHISNNGATWNSSSTGIPQITTFVFYQNQMIVAGSLGELRSTTDQGASFTALPQAPPGITAMLVDGVDIFIGTGSSGVYKSSDGGVTWVPSSNGLTNLIVNELGVLKSNLYASSDQNLYSSSNSAGSWQPVNKISGQGNQFAFTVSGDTLFSLYYGYDGISYSLDKGFSWDAFNSNGLADYPTAIFAYRGRLFAGLFDGVYRYDGPSTTWIRGNSFPVNVEILSFFAKGDSLLAGGLNDIFLSKDQGTTWVPLNPNTPASFIASNMASFKNKLLASSNSGLFISSDKGSTWTKNDVSGTGTSVSTIFNYKQYLFAGLYAQGIFYSKDGGASWEVSQGGFPFTLTVNSFAVLNDSIYAGTSEGVWAADLKAFVNSPTGPSVTEVVNRTGYGQAYPNPTAGKIYFRSEDFDNTLPVQITIIDQLGQEEMVVTCTGSSVETDLSSLVAGMYIITATQQQLSVIQKVIKL